MDFEDPVRVFSQSRCAEWLFQAAGQRGMWDERQDVVFRHLLLMGREKWLEGQESSQDLFLGRGWKSFGRLVCTRRSLGPLEGMI